MHGRLTDRRERTGFPWKSRRFGIAGDLFFLFVLVFSAVRGCGVGRSRMGTGRVKQGQHIMCTGGKTSETALAAPEARR